MTSYKDRPRFTENELLLYLDKAIDKLQEAHQEDRDGRPTYELDYYTVDQVKEALCWLFDEIKGKEAYETDPEGPCGWVPELFE